MGNLACYYFTKAAVAEENSEREDEPFLEPLRDTCHKKVKRKSELLKKVIVDAQ